MTPTILALLLAAGLPVPPQASQLPPWYHWLFEAFRPAGGGSGTILTVTGISPLALVNALAAPIHSLTQYGLCVQDGTPTPSAPVDILCNNGAIKVSPNLANMVEANVVVGKYINNSGVETADTANFFYAPYVPVTPGGTYTMATSSSIWYFSVMQYDSSKNFLRRTIWGATNTPVGTEKTFGVGADCAYIRFGSNMRKATISLADVLAVDWMLTQTETAQEFRPYGEIYIDGTPEVLTIRGENLLDPSESNIAIGEIYLQGGEQVSSQNNWRTGFIPIEGGKTYAFWGRKKSDNTISAYNRINWFDADGNNISPRPSYTVDTVTVGTAPSNAAFAGLSCAPNNSSAAITRATFDLFDWMFAEASAEVPYQPYVTPQTVSGKNLFDVSTETQGYYIAADGTITGNAASAYSALIPCKPNTEYTFSGIARTAYGNKRIHAYDANGNWISQISYASSVPLNEAFSTTGTTPATASYLRISYSSADTDKQLEQGSSATDYEPYVSVPMLLGVGNYKDEVELIHGIKTGKVGVKVLDGTEDWLYSSGWSDTTHKCFYVELDTIKQQTTVTNECLCSHLEWYSRDSFYADKTIVGGCVSGYIPTDPESGRALTVRVSSSIAETANDFKAWLAAQYAAGTPVIVIYPLATEQTEQTTPHSLHSYNGTTIVTAQTNVDPVTLRVEYKGVVA